MSINHILNKPSLTIHGETYFGSVEKVRLLTEFTSNILYVIFK